MISSIFNNFFYRPLFNSLVFLEETVTGGDLGFAIVLLTVLIRILLYPLFHIGTKNQLAMQDLQPEIDRIKRNYKKNKEEQGRALLNLYKEKNINPFAGYFVLLLQLPILIALFRVFYLGFSDETFGALYSFVPRPQNINYYFLGLISLKEQSILMLALAAIAQFLQGYLALPKVKQMTELSNQQRLERQMAYLGPLLTVLVLYKLPAAVGLYWTINALFSIGQQYLIKRSLEKNKEKV